MRVVQVSTSSKGGAGIAALRLHYALRDQGISSAFISKDLTLNFEGKEIGSSFFNYNKPSSVARIKMKFSRLFLPTIEDRIINALKENKAKMRFEVLSLPFSKYDLEDHPLVKQADIVHLHWVGGILNYPSFFKRIDKVLVWTLHDRNPFQGLFHYKQDEIDNKELIGEIDALVLKVKRESISSLDRANIVSPSKWLMEAALKSKFFPEEYGFHHIPNSANTEIFKPASKKEIRKKHGIRESEFVLLYIADILNIPRKGSRLLINALEQLSTSLTLITVGKGNIKCTNKLVTIKNLGFVSDQVEMATYYALSNFLVLPSTEDNLPNTMLESFSCGIPIISFKVGGMYENVTEDFNGKFAQEISPSSLSQTISEAKQSISQFDPEKIRSFALEKFTFEKLASNYKNFYSDLNQRNR